MSEFIMARKPNGDAMLIELLDDGNVRWVTNPISGVNHGSAEALIVQSNQEFAGTLTRAKRTDVARKSGQVSTGLKQRG